MISKKRLIESKILEYLKNKGKATDKELYEVISREFDISLNQLLVILMQLEMEGFITVYEGKDYIVLPKKTLNIP
uniref:Winged helix-turn-helix domain-containing protein n=1 Tax=Ignisphaera aggregans TaxID=334771 RepID=A0A7C2Z220_9CREN